MNTRAVFVKRQRIACKRNFLAVDRPVDFIVGSRALAAVQNKIGVYGIFGRER